MKQNETIEPQSDNLSHKINTVERIRQWILSLPIITTAEFEQLDLNAQIIHEVASNATPDEFLGLEQDQYGFTLVRYRTAQGVIFKRTQQGWHRWRAKTDEELLADQAAAGSIVDSTEALELAVDPFRSKQGMVKELPTSRSTWRKI